MSTQTQFSPDANQSFSNVQLRDPREAYPKPPFDQQGLFDMPGSTTNMTPKPDHGEQTYRGSGKLKGLNALVTGGDSGIGRAIAIAYAREGANVAINYLSETEDAETTAEFVKAAGSHCVLFEGDLREETFCNRLIDQTVSELGGIDLLVNNAAYQTTSQEIEDFSSETFDRIFQTNVYAPFWLCRAAMSQLPAGGSIINTVSIQGYNPSPYLLPYSMTKSALIGMTKALAKLAMEHGIRANAVAPGPVWTPLIPGSMLPDKVEQFGKNTLLGRPAQPAELAPLYVWLASPEASYVTAEVFGCTGGKTPV
ncbi:SDR family oxidoreductase [Neorhodopirellula pilleata]|uniref:Putative oxidoreductase YghA n=1 Tax=Neorhodopirellula pilleata TaxID=2714738 RepID=A0A5C6ADS1_9BACT|nr:SDR family oxidoreductase [Neorhodopirellula pilleata]TWT97448.1 putative oxidoreductase YghA [Neorhodopirellula pilleata]